MGPPTSYWWPCTGCSTKFQARTGPWSSHGFWNVYNDQSSVKSTSDEKLGMKSELFVQFDDLFKKAWDEDLVEFEGDGQLSGSESIKSDDEANVVDVEITSNPPEPELSVLDEILSVEAGDSKSRFNGAGEQNPEAWAVSGCTEWIAENFNDLVPDKALDFPFELDKFQKE